MQFSLIVAMFVIFLSVDVNLSKEHHNHLIKEFIKRVRQTFQMISQNQIHIAIPDDFYNVTTNDIFFWKNHRVKELAFKTLFSSSYVAANTFNSLHRRNYSDTVLTMLPYDMSTIDTCQWMPYINESPQNVYLWYVSDSSLSKQALKACSINYDTNFNVFYTVNSSTLLVEEIYKINNSYPDMEQNLLLAYDTSNNTVSYQSSVDKWKRRKNLKGMIFDGLAIPLRPYVTHTKSSKVSPSEFSGLFVEVIDVLGAALNFTVNKNLPKRYDYNELIRTISMKKADIGIGIISITYDRSFLVDFSLSIKEERNSLFYPKTRVKIKWMGYLRPFSADSWIAIILQVLITAFVIGVFSVISRDFISSNTFLPTVSRSLVFSTYSAIAKRFPFEPKTFTCRVAFLSISLAGFVLINLYKAMLGASLAIVKEHQPLSSMKDVLKSDYSIVTLGGTTQETYFTKADKASYLYKISEKKLISTQINTGLNKDGILGMFWKSIESNDDVLIFFQEDYTYPHPELECRLSRIDERYMAVGTGFIFPKNWSYTKLFNVNILRMIEDGRVAQLKNKWLSTRSIRCEDNDIRPSSLHDIYPLVITLAFGGALSVILLFIERYGINCVYR